MVITEDSLTYLPGESITLESINEPTDLSSRHTKIICTLGPSCSDEETLGKMINTGMNMARINCYKGEVKDWVECMDRLRKVAKEKNRNVAFMLETTGPELRSGYYADNATAISLTKGEHIIITTDFAYLGDRKKKSP